MKLEMFIALILLCSACSIDRSISDLDENEMELLSHFNSLSTSNQLTMASKDEPGEKLRLCLTFVNKENQMPIPGQKAKFYHTSSEGEYQPSDPTDESTARLSGYATTDNQGRIFIQTILPGDYGSSADNRHIHTTVENARPEAYDIHFKQYASFMSRRFISGSDQHFLADLKQADNGTLVAFLTIEVKHPQ